MKQRKVIIIAVITGTILLGIFLFLRKGESLTEQAAITVIKQKYPLLQDYPSDELPPRTISTTRSGDKWYIAFVQNGSGSPILEARCFIVSQDYSIVENGTFVPKPGSTVKDISPITCDTV